MSQELSPQEAPALFSRDVISADSSRGMRGITLIEIIIVMSIISILAASGIPIYYRTKEAAESVTTVADLKTLDKAIEVYFLQNGRFPDSLADVGYGGRTDPWGEPYEYLNFSSVHGNGQKRKDHFLVPINLNYDLYSKGPDRKTAPPLTAKASRDDIIRGRDGRYFGVASEY